MSHAGRGDSDAQEKDNNQDSAVADVAAELGACAVSAPCSANPASPGAAQPQQLAVGAIDRPSSSPQRKMVKNVQSVIPRNR